MVFLAVEGVACSVVVILGFFFFLSFFLSGEDDARDGAGWDRNMILLDASRWGVLGISGTYRCLVDISSSHRKESGKRGFIHNSLR